MSIKNDNAEKSEKKSPMTAEEWKKVIEEQCAKLGYMIDAFAMVIDSLAQILERRDLVYQEFLNQGAQVTVDKISDRRAVNKAKNPLYVVWNELNTQALAYWRELGCTPRSVIEIEKKNNEFMNDVLHLLIEYERNSINEENLFFECLKREVEIRSDTKEDQTDDES